MEMTRDEIKEKLLELKKSLDYGKVATIGGNVVYLHDISEDGFSDWGWLDGQWSQITTAWAEVTEEELEALEKFIIKKTPKEYKVTRNTYLIDFKNVETEEILTVNLKEKKFTKTNAKAKSRDIKYPHSFFKGMDGRIIANKIPADDNFKKLVDTIIDKEFMCSNMGTFLVRLFDNIHLETYISANVPFNNRIKVGYDYFDKDVRKVLNANKMVYNETVGRFFGNDHDLGKSVLYYIKDDPTFLETFTYLSRDMRHLVTLVQNYKYDVKRLFEYCKERNWQSHANRWGGRDLLSYMVDYARMAELVFPNGFDKYPENIVEWHDGVVKLYEKEKIKFDDELYKKLINPKLEYKTKDFVMIFPKSTGDIQSEGRMLGHCVGSYVNSILKGQTTILFMRKKDDENTSLVTVEVRDNNITQARGKFNRALLYDETVFLKDYAEKKKLTYRGTGY